MPDGTDYIAFLLAGSFLMGLIFAQLLRAKHSSAGESNTQTLDKQYKSLQAENNVLSRKLATANEALEAAEKALAESEQRRQEIQVAFEARSDQLEMAKTDLRDAVRKTKDLRKDLVQHAEDTLRAEVKARDVTHELDMLQSSGEMLDTQVLTEFSRKS